MKILLTSIEKVKNFVEIALQQNEDIFVSSGRYIVDGKSILGIFSLNLMEPLNVVISTEDETVKHNFENRLREGGLEYETQQN